MRKLFLTLMLAMSMLFCCVPVWAADNDFVIENGVLIKYQGSGGVVTIPNGVRSIAYNAFWYCDSITGFAVTPDNTLLSVEDGVLYSKDKTVLVRYPQDKPNSTFVVPDNVTKIQNYAFSNCKNLTSITIPDSVTSIGEGEFEFCENLTSITIPGSVTSIDDYAFLGCENLTSITIPSSVTSIGKYAFQQCDNLTSITILGSVTSIGERAFLGCYNLTSINIPSSVTSIGELAFADCVNLTSVTIPGSVTSIGEEAFLACENLTSITIPDSVMSIGESAFVACENLSNIFVSFDNQYYFSEAGVLYNKDKTRLLCYPASKTEDSLVIPDSVTSIEKHAFAYCKNLTSITIPSSVTSIGKYAFWPCDNLTSVTIPDSVTSIGERAFEGCDKLTIYGAAGSTADKYAKGHYIPFSVKVGSAAQPAASGIKIILDGENLSFSQAPYTANGSTMVPMRVIFEALGADVDYNAASQKITASKGDTTIELVIGSKTAKKNGQSINLDAAAVTQNGSTMVPLRFVAEALQATVDWDNATQTVTIKSK